MYRWILLLLLFPAMVNAQSKRVKQKKEKQAHVAKEKANQLLEQNLMQHIKYLASDSLEGRRTGTKGEIAAMNYIVKQYTQMGIEPKGTNGYIQEFDIDEGKKVTDNSFLIVNNDTLILNEDYYPLAFSSNAMLSTNVAIALKEKSHPWFEDVSEALEENKNNPHFDIDEYIKTQAQDVTQKGASALFVYNSSANTDNIFFNKNDKSAVLSIPIIYFKSSTIKKYFEDVTVSKNVALSLTINNNSRKARNVVAYINNNAPTTIIIGAHYDHLGYGEDRNALDALHEVHNGADDNASGTAALIELAKKLKNTPAKNNNYLIINFSAEELGLFGSKYWLDNPTIDITPNYMINMDMVGRYDTAHKLTIGGYGTSPLWNDVFTSVSNKNLIIKFDSSGSGPSDHASFYRAGIPVLFFFTGSHSDYHKTTDDWEKINYSAQKDIINLIYNIVQVTDTKGKLTFTKTKEPQVGKVRFSVSLGVIPDYGYTGTGLRIEGTSPGKIGEKIGLQTGDILLQLGEYKFVDINSYMTALSKFKKGDATKLHIRRGETNMEFDIVF
ncbi:MAG: M28 family peptidase [Chitinophagaceae bacterium]|nr:M28 family peptidase [Chitinophagaceae bacterium]MCW5905817.1 M28 family peptidase [Chitinophagaceae bacterium]